MALFKRTYPYFVAGLPDLLYEVDYKNFDLQAIINDMREQIHPDDIKLGDCLYYDFDILNLNNILVKRALPFVPRGVFSLEELQEEIAEPQRLPDFMKKFVDAFMGRSDDDIIEVSEANHKLTEAFYEFASHSPSPFLRKWFDFDRSLRNIQAAYLSRKTNRDPERYLVVGGSAAEDVEIILKNFNVGDFGIKPFVDFADRLFQIFEIGNLLERERKLDLLRWETADELSKYNYFDMDRILAYLVQANIIDRWSKLDEERGKLIFTELIMDLKKINLR